MEFTLHSNWRLATTQESVYYSNKIMEKAKNILTKTKENPFSPFIVRALSQLEIQENLLNLIVKNYKKIYK